MQRDLSIRHVPDFVIIRIEQTPKIGDLFGLRLILSQIRIDFLRSNVFQFLLNGGYILRLPRFSGSGSRLQTQIIDDVFHCNITGQIPVCTIQPAGMWGSEGSAAGGR